MNGLQRASIVVAAAVVGGVVVLAHELGVVVALATLWSVSLLAVFTVFRFEQRWYAPDVPLAPAEPAPEPAVVAADDGSPGGHGKLTHHDRQRRTPHGRVSTRV